jgi:hypothetical protein
LGPVSSRKARNKIAAKAATPTVVSTSQFDLCRLWFSIPVRFVAFPRALPGDWRIVKSGIEVSDRCAMGTGRPSGIFSGAGCFAPGRDSFAAGFPIGPGPGFAGRRGSGVAGMARSLFWPTGQPRPAVDAHRRLFVGACTTAPARRSHGTSAIGIIAVRRRNATQNEKIPKSATRPEGLRGTLRQLVALTMAQRQFMRRPSDVERNAVDQKIAKVRAPLCGSPQPGTSHFRAKNGR